MQAPNAQGLAGLMSRPQSQPQAQPQQQMPSPNKASPMAGLGSVEDRVSAYRGNPAPLQQRYAMSQDLLDLLALQKLKSEKEAAARQMQLSMGQQAAAQGGEPPTIAQQREKEVMDMTKNELAQQRGATANQQVSEQQQAMQRMMGGIAEAPGANAAAQPKMMAAGGIVGYADGGDVDEEQTTPAGRALRGALGSMRTQGKEQAERQMLRDALIEKYRGAAGPVGLFKSQSDAQRTKAQEVMSRLNDMSVEEMRAELQGTPTPPAAPMGAGAGRGMVNPTMADPNTPLPPPQAGIAAGVTPPAQTGIPAALPTAPRPMPAPAGLAGMPGAQGAQGAPMGFGTPTDPLAVAGRKASMDAIGRDSAQAGLTEEQRVEQRLAFPEEQERRRKVIEEQRQADAREFDPERQRREALKRFLIGAGGRAYGEFGAGAQASMGYDDEQAKAKAMRRKALEDMEQGIFSLKKGAVEGGIGAGADVRKQTEEARRAGLGAAANLYGTDVQAKTAQENRLSEERRAELSRQVQMAQVQAQRESNAITKGAMDENRLETRKQQYLRDIQNVRKLVEDKFAGQRDMLLMDLRSNDPKKYAAAQQRMRELDMLVDAQVAKDAKIFLTEVSKIEGKLGGTGGTPDVSKYNITKISD